MSKRYIILCEAGWHNARELSLEMAVKNIRNVVLIKGRPDREVVEMISKRSLIKNIFIPDKLFSVYSFLYILFNSIMASEVTIFFNKDKMRKMLSSLEKISHKIKSKKITKR